MAWLGHGVYALVLGSLGRVALESLLFLWLGDSRFRSGFVFSLNSISKYLNFGWLQATERLVVHLLYQVDVLIIGKLLGLELLGVYEIFKRVLNKIPGILATVVDQVSYPLFSKNRSDKKWINTAYLKTLFTYNSLSFPIIIAVVVMAYCILELFFGHKWTTELGLFQLMAIWVLINSINNPLDNLLIAIGQIKNWIVYNMGLLLCCSVAIILGSQFGLNGVLLALIAYGIMNLLVVYPILLRPNLPISFTDYFKAIVQPLFLAILINLPLVFVDLLSKNVYIQFLVGGFLFIISFFLINYFFNPSLHNDFLLLTRAKHENTDH